MQNTWRGTDRINNGDMLPIMPVIFWVVLRQYVLNIHPYAYCVKSLTHSVQWGHRSAWLQTLSDCTPRIGKSAQVWQMMPLYQSLLQWMEPYKKQHHCFHIMFLLLHTLVALKPAQSIQNKFSLKSQKLLELAKHARSEESSGYDNDKTQCWWQPFLEPVDNVHFAGPWWGVQSRAASSSAASYTFKQNKLLSRKSASSICMLHKWTRWCLVYKVRQKGEWTTQTTDLQQKSMCTSQWKIIFRKEKN